MKIWQIITVLLLCVVLAGSTACDMFGGEGEEAGQQLFEVVRDDLIISVSGSGNIDISNEAELAFGVGGKVDEIYVDEDDEVGKGDVLAKLDSGALELALTEAQLAKAQAQLTRAQAESTRAQAKADLDEAEYDLYILKKRHVSYEQQRVAKLQIKVAESQLEAAELQLEVIELQIETAEQAITEAQKQLDWATITTPFDGTITSVNVDEGDTVLATEIIVHLIDLTSMELNVEVDEIDIAEVKPGQKAITEVDALPALQLEGEVTSISLLPEVEAGVVMYEVKIAFDAPLDFELKVGMSADTDIIINERKNVLLVPNRAITQDSQGNPVVNVVVDDEIEERPVVTGISDGYDTEFVVGLNEGEVVVRKTR